MTLETFKNLKEGSSLYDAKLSRRRRRHIFATVQGYDKATGDILIHSEGMEEAVSINDHFNWNLFDPETQDTSELPFY